MATRSEKILKCDQCGAEVSDKGQQWYGGHPFSGWLTLHESGGSTALEALSRKRDWDFCSRKCLSAFLAPSP
jgi:hypothetical protein